MTINTLIDTLYDRLYGRIRKHELRLITNYIIDEINIAISNGDQVKLKQLGSFKLKLRKARTIKVPRKEKPVQTKEHYIVQFSPSKKILESAAFFKKTK